MAHQNSIGISFDNLAYKTKFGIKRETKEILHGISAHFPAGHFTAILGPSGSGKSTLLNILADCIISYQGKIKYYYNQSTNERKSESSNTSQAVVIYIPQETYLCAQLTVKETFQSAAAFKIPKIKNSERGFTAERIKNIVNTLGLSKVYHSRVGCLSGGERKRVTLGIELLSDFDIIILDEPTTGLDSKSSQICIEYLKSLSSNGKTVICTIHQPSATILQRFDYLYVLSDGWCLYEGTNDLLINVLDKYNMKCPLYHNLADYILEIASGEYGNAEDSVRMQLIERFRHPRLQSTQDDASNYLKELSISGYVASSCCQLKTLFYREYLKTLRNPTLTYLRLATSVLNSLVLCFIFWQVGNDASKVWFNYNSILGFVLHLMMPSLMLTILTFPSEYAVLKRESINRWYSLKWYYLAVTMIDLPICIIYCLVSNAIFYVLTDQVWELWRFITFTGLAFMIIVVAQSFRLLVGSLLNVVNGTFVGSAISFPMMLFAGFGMTFKDIPPYIKWIGHFSYLKYGVEGMAASVMGYNRTALSCSKQTYCQYIDSQVFLDEMGIASNQIYLDYIVLIGFFISLRLVTYVCLKKRVFYKF